MKTAEEKAREASNDYGIDDIQHRTMFASGYLQGYNEAMRCQSSPKIKQLEWVEGYGYIKAKTPFFEYMVVIIGEKAGLCFYGNDEFLIFKTVDEAKAAAQADFDRRVMECLDYE